MVFVEQKIEHSFDLFLDYLYWKSRQKYPLKDPFHDEFSEKRSFP